MLNVETRLTAWGAGLSYNNNNTEFGFLIDNPLALFQGSPTFAAGDQRPGDIIRIQAFGTFTTEAVLANTLRATVQFPNETPVYAIPIAEMQLSLPNNASGPKPGVWEFDCRIVIDAGGGTYYSFAAFQFYSLVGPPNTGFVQEVAPLPPFALPILDTTAPQSVEFVTQMGFADPANSVALTMLTIERLRPCR